MVGYVTPAARLNVREQELERESLGAYLQQRLRAVQAEIVIPIVQ